MFVIQDQKAAKSVFLIQIWMQIFSSMSMTTVSTVGLGGDGWGNLIYTQILTLSNKFVIICNFVIEI